MSARHRNTLAILRLSLLFLVFDGTAQDWPGFHGLERQGVAPEAAHGVDWYGQISTNWSTPVVGFGYSSPVIAGQDIYLTTAYERQKGKIIRNWLAYLNQALSWALVVVAALVSVRVTATIGYGRWMRTLNGCRGFLIMSAALLILGVCLFSEGLFNLQSATLRSWKIGTATAFISLLILPLLMPWSRPAPVIFALLATLLSASAYFFLPQSELFLNFAASGGLISTCVILLPALIGWGVCIAALWLARANRPATADRSNVPVRFGRVALYCGLPTLLTVGVLWGLMLRMLDNFNSRRWNPPDEAAANIHVNPLFGWPFMAVIGVLALLAVMLGSMLVSKRPKSLRMLPPCGAIAALFLALGSFFYFSGFSLEREMVHAVVCIDKKTGAVRWLREVDHSSTITDLKGVNSHATPTVAVGETGICAYFGSAGLYGLDHKGKISWRVGDADFHSPYGIGHSPVIADEIVVLANDNEKYPDDPSSKSHIIAYSRKDGRVLWRQERARSQRISAGFSTPIVRTVKGRKTILMRGWEDLTAYDLHTGQVFWTHQLNHRSAVLVASLVSDDKHVYVLDGGGVRALDLDALAEKRDPVAWLVPAPAEKVATPVLVDGLLFFASDTGVAFCVDIDKKSLAWRERLGGRFFASPVAQGNYVIFVDESGKVSVVARDRRFKLVAEIEMGEKVYATPAPQADGLLIRGATNLFYLKPGQPLISTSAAAPESGSSE
jgi:outer membrane protein assembly factor BamB